MQDNQKGQQGSNSKRKKEQETEEDDELLDIEQERGNGMQDWK
jgi:hypothetical protein